MNKKGEKIVAIIIARGGSKSIPRKNVLPLHGKPLIAWPIDLAKSVDAIDRVIVSTDDDEIAEIARQHGAEVPFKRPAELAEDETPTLPVLQHCIQYLEEKEKFFPDLVLLFYPTSPFLKKVRVEEAIEMLSTGECNSVVSVTEDYKHYWVNENGRPRRLYPLRPVNRQYAVPAYKEDGAIYFNRRDVIMNQKTLLDEQNCGLLVVRENEHIDIDEPEDFENAQVTIQ
jgi:CMP-N,N'-diacetyllegionaminic acid synthase